MTTNIEKATEILKLLSEYYEQTKDPTTAEKIILLVESEFIDDYNNDPREEEIRINWYSSFGFIKRRAMQKSRFRVYRELKLEREDANRQKEAERLDTLYSIDAKSPTQIKEEKEAIEKRVYSAVEGEIGYIARSAALADEMLGRAMLSRPIMDVHAQESISSLSHFLNEITHRILWIAQCNEKGQLTDDTIDSPDGYVKYLSNQFVSEKMTSQWDPANWPDDFSENTKKEWTVIYFELEMRNRRFALLDEILNERILQIIKHGYSESHDDEHSDGSIADAAAHYASTKDDAGLWPWDVQYDKKDSKSRRDQLITSIAMLISEVERVDRASKKPDIPPRLDEDDISFGINGQLQKAFTSQEKSILVDLGPKFELTPYLYMHDSVDRFIRDASEISRTFVVCKDLREDHGHKQWFPQKGDRVRLVWKKPNKGIMTEFGPVEVTATLVLVEDETKQLKLTQSSIIECIENEEGVGYARTGAAFYWADCSSEDLLKLYNDDQNEDARSELVHRGVL